jgi:hypothetical protein
MTLRQRPQRDPNAAPRERRERREDTNVNRQTLGGKNMEGVYVEGTQVTRTIPEARIGNDEPIEIVSTRWHSPDLGLDVELTTTDPLRGNRTMKLSNLDRSEPAASLFQVPPDYTVTEATGQRFGRFRRGAPPAPPTI